MGSRPFTLRLPHEFLLSLEDFCEETGDRRNKFIARCGLKQARRILKGSAPTYYHGPDLNGDDRTPVVVSLRDQNLDTITRACKLINHRVSLFLVWSTLVELPKELARLKTKRNEVA